MRRRSKPGPCLIPRTSVTPTPAAQKGGSRVRNCSLARGFQSCRQGRQNKPVPPPSLAVFTAPGIREVVYPPCALPCERGHQGRGGCREAQAWQEGRSSGPGSLLTGGTSLLCPGDVFQKPYVSGEADSASRELTGSEDYLLLACDGFFDVVPHQEVAGLVWSCLVRQGSGLHVAEELVAAARERGSRDNITVVVVFLRDPRDLLEGGAQGAGDLPSGLSELETNTPERS